MAYKCLFCTSVPVTEKTQHMKTKRRIRHMFTQGVAVLTCPVSGSVSLGPVLDRLEEVLFQPSSSHSGERRWILEYVM